MSNLGTISASNLILSNSSGSINFLSSLNSTPHLGVVSTLFDKSFALESGNDSFDTYTTANSTIARDTGKDYLSLRSPDGGGSAILQTKQYVVSTTGASRIVTAVATLDPANTIPAHPGLVARVGSFDSSAQKTDDQRGDGFFFQLSSTGLACVRRSSVTGTDVDEVIPQAAFNLDRLDGTGLSQYTLSGSRANVFLFVYEQTGYAASVKLGIVAGTAVVFCHRFDQKSGDTNAVRTSSLPVRFELTNATTGSGLATEMRAISCSVSSSGGVPRGVRRSCGLKAQARDLSSNSVATPVLSVRLKSNYARASAKMVGLHLSTTTAIYYELVINGVLTGANWSNSADNSITEFDKSATQLTGGRVVESGYCGDKQTMNIVLPDSLTPLASSITGLCDIYSLNVICLMSSGLLWASIDLAEIA